MKSNVLGVTKRSPPLDFFHDIMRSSYATLSAGYKKNSEQLLINNVKL